MIQRVVTNQSKSIARGCKIEIMTLENWKIDLPHDPVLIYHCQ